MAKLPKYSQNKSTLEDFSDPAELKKHLTDNTADFFHAAPNITQGIHSTVTNGLQYLNGKLPVPVNPMPLSKDHEPPTQSQHHFNHSFDIVDNPLSALEHVKNGTLSSLHMEALQNVYPNLLKDMQKKVLEHMDLEKAKDLPYPTKLSLSKFIGQPLDESMTPQGIVANQAAMTPPQQAMNAGQPNKPMPASSMKDMDVAGRAATRSQQLESPEKA